MKHIPILNSDKAVEDVLVQDLSDLDFSQFKAFNWERQPKTARVNMRLPQGLIDLLKAKAKAKGVPYQRLIREAIEKSV
jgi:predicted DNA binding CopG/RHH family protein